MHSRRAMANQNGRGYPGRNGALPSFHRDDDRYGARRDDDHELEDRYERGWSWRPDDRGQRDERRDDRRDWRGDRRTDQRFDGGFEDRGRGRRDEPFSEAMPRQDQLLRGAYRDHDESNRDLSYHAGRPSSEPSGPPYGQTDERTREARGGAGGTSAPARERTPQRRGPHHGKGPVGFQRSDERIRELVCEALTDDGEVDATYIEVSVTGGEVTLIGAIEDRRMKRLAEDCVEAVPGVKDVHNQLRIGEPQRTAEPSDKKPRPS